MRATTIQQLTRDRLQWVITICVWTIRRSIVLSGRPERLFVLNEHSVNIIDLTVLLLIPLPLLAAFRMIHARQKNSSGSTLKTFCSGEIVRNGWKPI